MLQTFLTGWVEWWETLPPEFAFLTALPFGVAVAALLRGIAERHHARHVGGECPAAAVRTADRRPRWVK